MLTLILFFSLAGSSVANPLLVGESLENTDYYYLNIDDAETQVIPYENDLFKYDLVDTPDGVHVVKITGWHETLGEGQCVIFNINVESDDEWRRFIIERVPAPSDPYYDYRFSGPQEVKIKQPTLPDPPGATCFIGALK